MGYAIGKDTNILKSFSLKLKSKSLTQTQVQLLKIKWNVYDLKVIGILEFLDTTSIVEEEPIRGGEKIVIGMQDFDDKNFNHTFIITSVSYSRTKDIQNKVSITFIDEISYDSMRLFPEMSWEKASINEIIDDAKTLKSKIKKKKEFNKVAKKHENFVIPLNFSFNKVINWLSNHNNQLVFQDRKTMYIKTFKDLFSKAKSGKDFIYKANNESYRRNIYEFSTEIGNELELISLQPDSEIYSFDITKKEKKVTKKNMLETIDKMSSKGTAKPKNNSIGKKYFYFSDFSIEEEAEFMFEKNASSNLTVEMLVPGQFATNVGDIIKIDLVGVFDDKSPEKNIAGEWLITELTDMIVSTDFIQRMKLSRSKYTKG